MERLIIFSVMIILLSNCSTPYQPKGRIGGYSEQKLHNSLYRVEFAGNSSTKSEKVHDFLLYRCAELTKDLGYEYFYITNEERHFNKYSTINQLSGGSFRVSDDLPQRNNKIRNERLVHVKFSPMMTSGINYKAVYVIELIESVNEDFIDAVFNANEVLEKLSSIIK